MVNHAKAHLRIETSLGETSAFPVDRPQVKRCSCGLTTGALWRKTNSIYCKGTLDLLVLQTLASMGADARLWPRPSDRNKVGADTLMLNQGTIYAGPGPATAGKWIDAEWGTSDNNRKANTNQSRSSRKRLGAETENWQRMSNVRSTDC